jgi:type II secretory pathway component PulF
VKVSHLDTARFARDLSGLLALGYTLEEAVQKTGESQSTTFRSINAKIVEALQKGQTLTESLQPHETQFPLFYRFVESAELSETLPKGLARSAEILEEIAERRQRSFLTTLYPTLVLTFGAIGIWVTLILCGSLLSDLFAGMNLTLPLPTRALLTFFEFLQQPLLSLLYFAPLVLLWMMVLGKTPLSGWLYKLPLFGTWLLRQEAVMYVSTVGHLTSLGTQLTDATRIASQVCSPPVREMLKNVPDRLMAGDLLSQALQETRVVPDLAIWAIERREETEDLRLADVAGLIDRELTLVRSTGLVLFEPFIFLVTALFIVSFVVSVFLPIYQLVGNLG